MLKNNNNFISFLTKKHIKRVRFMKKVSTFFKKLDFISNEIRLTNMEQTGTRHQSAFGGVIEIILISLSITVCVYFFLDLVIKTNPKAYQITKYQDDTPIINFPNNKFLGVKFYSPLLYDTNQSLERAVTFFAHTVNMKKKEDFYQTRYKLSKCVFSYHYKGIENLFNEEEIKDINKYWMCIDKMLLNGEEISLEDSRFIPPYTIHGMGSKTQEPIYFEVGANRCVNSTDNNYSCYSDEMINEALSGSNYQTNFIDNNFDPTNYYEPIPMHIKNVMGGSSSQSFAQNYLNFNNVIFKTYDGWLFENENIIYSYEFSDRVEIATPIIKGNWGEGKVFFLRFEGQNSPKIYERYYVKIQEVLANTGGVLKVFVLIAKLINYFYMQISKRRKILEYVFLKFIDFDNDILAEEAKFEKKKGENVSVFYVKNFEHSEHNEMIEIPQKQVKEDTEILSSFSKNKSNKDVDTSAKIAPAKLKQTFGKPPLKKISTVNDSMKISFGYYSWLKIKRAFTFKRSSPNQFLQSHAEAEKMERNLFNELTIYQLYFEVEKLKRLLLTQEQINAFDLIKFKLSDIYKIPSSSSNSTNILIGLQGCSDPISQKIVRILEKKEKI